jgi:hypothetical protein
MCAVTPPWVMPLRHPQIEHAAATATTQKISERNPLRSLLSLSKGYSTVTLFARFRGLSTSHPRATAT